MNSNTPDIVTFFLSNDERVDIRFASSNPATYKPYEIFPKDHPPVYFFRATHSHTIDQAEDHKLSANGLILGTAAKEFSDILNWAAKEERRRIKKYGVPKTDVDPKEEINRKAPKKPQDQK